VPTVRPRFLALLSRFRPSAQTALYIALALFATAPAWIVKYPPMMDLPFHLATIRVIHSIHDPAFGLDDTFVLTLGRTQYVVYYIVGSVLSYVLGVVKANIVLVSLYLGGTVLSLRALLRALGKDERLCIFVVPLLVNMMFMYGLFPFLVGIPLMFVALAVAVRHFERPTLERGILLGVLTLALFYSHIFPFAIFGLGFAAMFPWTQPNKWLRAAAPPIPALLVLVWWTTSTTAGKLVLGALLDSRSDPRQPLDASTADVHNWFLNVFADTSDEKVLIALFVLALVATGFAQGERDHAKPVARAYVLLPVACVFFYFTSTQGHGYIWLIQQRFPLLFAMTGIPLLRMPSGWRGALATTGAVGLSIVSTVNVCKHFIDFQLEEVGDIDGAIATMDPAKHVMALIYDRGTSIMHPSLQPFLHYGAYYQLHKGGVVMFTYAGYAHWPFAFKPGHYTPQGESAKPRWEWMPEQVPVTEIFPYYDYVLTRGAGFHPPAGTYHVKWRSDRWTVWQKD
jgi:hypothetical protein